MVSKKGKINFFNQNQKAFFLNPESDEWFQMIKEYAVIENLSEEKIEELTYRNIIFSNGWKWVEIKELI